MEQFTYDELNRLSTSAVTTGVSPCPSPTTVPTGTAGAALSVTYDPIGDITCKQADCSGGQTYQYGDNSHLHAVTSVNGLPGSYAYDADGNLSCRDTAGASCSGSNPTPNIAWNVDNLPTTIVGNGGTSTFSYGPDQERYQQGATDSGGNSTSTTYVAGGLFQVVTVNGFTSYRHDILAEGAMVAMHTIDQTGKVTTDYLHSDHLGSSDVITDEKGNIATDAVTHVAQVMSFDAFGQRRDPNTWGTLGSSTGLTGITNQGYTAQEQLDNVGLVHMNGRVYDPVLGRMVSADPTIPAPMYSQAFNRYAYVYNNPLAYWDPTGFDAASGGPCPQDAGSGNHCSPGSGGGSGGSSGGSGGGSSGSGNNSGGGSSSSGGSSNNSGSSSGDQNSTGTQNGNQSNSGDQNNQGQTAQLGTVTVTATPINSTQSSGYNDNNANCYTCVASLQGQLGASTSTQGANSIYGSAVSAQQSLLTNKPYAQTNADRDKTQIKGVGLMAGGAAAIVAGDIIANAPIATTGGLVASGVIAGSLSLGGAFAAGYGFGTLINGAATDMLGDTIGGSIYDNQGLIIFVFTSYR